MYINIIKQEIKHAADSEHMCSFGTMTSRLPRGSSREEEAAMLQH